MRNLIVVLLALSFGSCAANKLSVRFPDSSEKSPAWVCVKDPDDEKVLLCLDMLRALKMMGGEAGEVQDQTYKPTNRL